MVSIEEQFFRKIFHSIVVCLGKLGRDMITALRPYSAFMGKWQKCEQLDDTHTQDTFFFQESWDVVFPGKIYKLFCQKPLVNFGNNFMANFETDLGDN